MIMYNNQNGGSCVGMLRRVQLKKACLQKSEMCYFGHNGAQHN